MDDVVCAGGAGHRQRLLMLPFMQPRQQQLPAPFSHARAPHTAKHYPPAICKTGEIRCVYSYPRFTDCFSFLPMPFMLQESMEEHLSGLSLSSGAESCMTATSVAPMLDQSGGK